MLANLGIQLDPRDHEIITLASAGVPQVAMAKQLGISQPSVFKRVERLVKSGILVKVNSRPRAYCVSPTFTSLTGSPSEKVPRVETHDLRVKLVVKGNHAEFEAFRAACKDQNQMENWTKKYLHLNGVKFEISTQSIIFHVTGMGRNAQDSLDNAKDKAINVRDFLQQKFNLKLEFPVFPNVKPHHVPIPVSKEQYEQLRDVNLWSDKSHPGLLETDDPAVADAIVQAMTRPSIEQGIQQQLNELKEQQAQLVQSVSALVQALQGLAAPAGSGAGEARPPPGGMTI